MYRYEAVSIQGFVQQLAVGYVANGYWFYVTGLIPAHKDPRRTDEKIIGQYCCNVSKWVRARRKLAGLSNVQYLRFGRFFALLATAGRHLFFEAEANRLRDIRDMPLKFAGYAVGCRERAGVWHASVRIERECYKDLLRHFSSMALKMSVDELRRELSAIPFEPYAAVRQQFLTVLRAVNRKRATAGLEPLPYHVLRLRRRPVLPFGASGQMFSTELTGA